MEPLMSPISTNLLVPSSPGSRDETFEELLRGGRFRLERIVSTGQATPEGQWYDQETDEWVVVLAGASRLRFEDEPEPRDLRPGDHVHIPARRRHRVEWTDPERPTIWLALHFTPEAGVSKS
jgi:cupin 2 domain-containing protein